MNSSKTSLNQSVSQSTGSSANAVVASPDFLEANKRISPNKPKLKSLVDAILFLLLAAAIFIGTHFRLSNLEQREYYIDEALTSLNVAGYTYKSVDVLQPGYRVIKAADLRNFQTVKRSPGKCLTALARNGGEHPPLYFVLSWCWQRLLGDSIKVMRLLPSLLSLLLMPAIYCLCTELFKNDETDPDLFLVGNRTALIATSIVALSPFQLLYAQYARQYSLWIVLTALSSYFLLRALRTQKTSTWVGYGLLSALSFYTHPLALAVSAAQVIYTVIVNKLRFTMTVSRHLKSLFVPVLLFLPWLAQMIIHKQVSDEMLKWLSRKVPWQSLIDTWMKNLAHLYFQIPGFDAVLIVLAFIITAAGSVALWVKGKRQFAFAAMLAMSCLLPMALPDIAFGGVRSQTLRYLMPCTLGLLIPIAFLFSYLCSARQHLLKLLGFGLLGIFLTCEILSLVTISKAAEHEELPMHGVSPRGIAQVLNNADNPLVICPVGRKYMSYMLTLSHYLRPSVSLLVCSSDEIPPIPSGYTSLYIFNPTYDCFSRFQRDPRFRIEELANLKTLWRMYYSGPTDAQGEGGNHG